MEAYGMLQVAAALFAIAALGGVVMAVNRLRGVPHPTAWLAMLHGFLAAAGATLLIYAAFMFGIPERAELALALIVVAALGGVVLNLAYHWRGRSLPVSIVMGHAALAVGGFVLLVLSLQRDFQATGIS